MGHFYTSYQKTVWSTENFWGNENTQYDTKSQIHFIIHLFRLIQRTTPSMNHTISYGLWVMIIFQYTVINFNVNTTLIENVDNGGGLV